ncbi:MAG: hypothetical protein H3Z52_15465 [archaeon]|nr:hypothetical protein [archaeon]MCP8322315.1 hypothetical protein [archaeon]
MIECLDRDKVLGDIRSEYARWRNELEQNKENREFVLKIFEEKIKSLLDSGKLKEARELAEGLDRGIWWDINQRRRLLVELSKDIYECPCCHGTGRHPPQMYKGKVKGYSYDCSTCEGKGNLKDWIEPH